MRRRRATAVAPIPSSSVVVARIRPGRLDDEPVAGNCTFAGVAGASAETAVVVDGTGGRTAKFTLVVVASVELVVVAATAEVVVVGAVVVVGGTVVVVVVVVGGTAVVENDAVAVVVTASHLASTNFWCLSGLAGVVLCRKTRPVGTATLALALTWKLLTVVGVIQNCWPSDGGTIGFPLPSVKPTPASLVTAAVAVVGVT